VAESGVAAAQALSLLFGALFLTYWAFILSHYLRRTDAEPGDARAFTWHLFVPCRDEAAVIGHTLAYLRQELPAAAVWVIDDDSADETAAITRVYESRDPMVHLVRRRRPDARTGKGDALNTAYRRLRAHLGPECDLSRVIVGVIDADGRPSANCLDVCAGPTMFGDRTVGGVQVEVRIMNTIDRRPIAHRGRVTNMFARTLVRMQDIEFRTVIGAIQGSRARTRTVGMGGNGQFTRLGSLAALDEGDGRAWRGSLLEDYELGLHLLLAGYRTAFTSTAWVNQEGLPDLRRYLTQRTRWGQGVMQCMRYLPRAWNSPKFTTAGALETTYYLFQPWLALLGTFVFPLPVIALVFAQSEVGNGVQEFLAAGGWALVSMYLVLGTTPFWLWGPLYRRRCAPEASRLASYGWGLAYLFYVYGFYITSWRAALRIARGEHGWSKTRRNAEFTTAPVAPAPVAIRRAHVPVEPPQAPVRRQAPVPPQAPVPSARAEEPVASAARSAPPTGRSRSDPAHAPRSRRGSPRSRRR